MKFSLTLILVSFTCLQATLAQKLNYGIKAGVNVNYFDVTLDPEPPGLKYKEVYHSSVAFHGGVFIEIDINKKFFYRQELEFIQKGAQIIIPNWSKKPDDIVVSYLQLPVISGYRFNDRLNVELGPVLSYRLSSKWDIENYPVVPDYLTVDFEISLTGGVTFNVFPRIDLQARYNLGLTDISRDFYVYRENPETGELERSEYMFKNRVVCISVLYYLKREK